MPKADSPDTTPKVTRNSQVMLTTPPTLAAMVHLVQPALERLTAGEPGVKLLVLVPDADTALAVAQALLPAGDASPILVPVTSAARGTRLLASAPSALIGAPADLAALLPSGLLKLDQVSQFLLLQADLTLSLCDEAPITALMTELPKDIARTVSMAGETDTVTAFAKAYLKRPRRVGDDVVTAGSAPVSMQYVLVTAATRAASMRRVLDAVNAPSTIIVAPDATQAAEANSALRALGYDASQADVKAVHGTVETHSVLRVLYDVPASRTALDAALGGAPVQVIALVTPRQVPHLRSLIAGGSLTFYILPDTMAHAVGRDGARLGELRKILAEGVSARELAALEPLLEDNDPMEVAAAALRLLERERETAKALRVGVTTAQPKEVKRALAATAQQESPVVPIESLAPEAAPAAPRPSGPPPEFQILWFNVGSDDGATASSFVGAITGETGLDRSVIGSIDLRDSHTLVEVSGAAAEQIVTAMNASTMRNRQVVARIDRAGPMRPVRSGPPRRGAGGGDRAGGFSRGDRPARPAFGRREEGGAPRERSGYPRRDDGDRPARTGGFNRDDRPARSGGFSRDDRPARTGGFSRDDRPARSGGFSRDDRPARPPREGGFSRDDRPARPPREGGFSREERPSRGGGFSRDERPARTGGFSRDDRPARPAGGGFSRGPRDGGAPTGRGFTRDRGDAPSGPRTEGSDFAERAERLRNSRKPTRSED